MIVLVPSQRIHYEKSHEALEDSCQFGQLQVSCVCRKEAIAVPSVHREFIRKQGRQQWPVNDASSSKATLVGLWEL